jgi:hypothetical protein
MGALKTLANSGSIGSQMRCTDMLQKVAKESSKMARFVTGDRVSGVVWVTVFKALGGDESGCVDVSWH